MSQVRNGPDEDLGGRMLEAGLTMDGMMDVLVSAALDDSAGNITEAGRRIGMTRSQVS